jgi:hypothetical protein
MKRLRLWLIVLAVPAGVLLGLREIGGTPISKGYDTGFEWQADSSNSRLVLSADPEGNMTCWIRLRIPITASVIRADTSTSVHLRVTTEPAEQGYEWIAITKDSGTPEDKFEWPSGAIVNITFQGQHSNLTVEDWQVFLSNKGEDSRHRADVRHIIFYVSLILLVLSLTGGTLEAVDKYRTKHEPFSPQTCVQLLIAAAEGANDKESESIRTILGKVLIEGTTVDEALAPIKLKPLQKRMLWFKAAGQFRTKLQFLIERLMEYESRLR